MEGKKGIQWRSTSALLGTEDPAGHPGSEPELKRPRDFCMSRPQPLRVALPLPQPALEPRARQAPVVPRAAGPAPPVELHGKDNHTAGSTSRHRFEQHSLPKGFLTGLWQVLERRSTQFSTVPLSKTASSVPFSVEMGQSKFFKGKKESMKRYKSLGSFPLTHLGTDHCGACRFMLSVIHTDWHKEKLLGLFRAGV